MSQQGNFRAIRVLIADDDALQRKHLVTELGRFADIDVVGEAADGQEAVELTLKLNPHVIVLDLSMPHCNGFAAASALRDESPGVKIVGLSMYAGPNIAERMRQAGADTFVSKEAPLRDLVDAIRSLPYSGSADSALN